MLRLSSSEWYMLIAPLLLTLSVWTPCPVHPRQISYTFAFPSLEAHLAQIKVVVPTDKAETLELCMPVWSPGYYHQEDYARKVKELTATSSEGTPLQVEKPAP